MQTRKIIQLSLMFFMTSLMVITQNCTPLQVEFSESSSSEVTPPNSLPSGGTNGSGEDPIQAQPPFEPVADVPQELRDICENSKRITTRLKFASTLNNKTLRCQWGKSGQINGRISGFLTEVQLVELPHGAHLCGLSLATPLDTNGRAPQLRYDDHFAVTLNGAVLISDMVAFLLLAEKQKNKQLLDRDGPLLLFDRPHVSYFAHPGNANSYNYKYCLGMDLPNSKCDIPLTETSGRFDVQIHPDLVKLAGLRAPQNHLQVLELHMTGDDDPTKDCRHSDIEFDLVMDYAL